MKKNTEIAVLERPHRRSRFGILPFVAATALVAARGARTTRRGRGLWYRTLRKSRANPPSWLFGPVWTTLYGLMSWSAYRVWKQPASPERSRALRLWHVQLALNGAWSELFFGKHRPRSALRNIIQMGATIGAYMRVAGRVDRVAAALFAPVLGWVGFAGFLNAQIVRRNRLAG
jgi:benzodiazapine receptor